MKKICMIVEDYPPNGGGGGIFVKEISKRLSKKNSITVVSRGEEDSEEKDGKIKVIRLSGTRMAFLLRAVEYLVNAPEFDIYHAHGAFAGLIAKKVKIFKKKPVILHIHGYRDMEYAGIVKYSIQNLILKSKFDWIIGSDETSSKKIKKLGIRKVTTIPNGVDFKKFKKSKTKKDIFLFVGRLENVKNPMIILEAVNKIEKKDLKLWVVGNGSLENKMKNYCKKNNLKNIKFFGYVNYDELGKVYSNSKFFILPSLSEGNPIALLEAMASGLPIIVSDIPSLTEIVKKSRAGVSFKSENSNDLAEKMKKMMKIKTERMKNAGRKYVEKNFSWDKTSKKIEEIYKKF